MADVTRVDTDQAADHLAQVRRLLRQREYRRALELIDRRLSRVARPPGPIPVEDMRTYAYERLVVHGPAPSWRAPVNLRRGAPLNLRRPIPVDLHRLSRPALERLLRWLLAGELRAAEDALRAGDHVSAVRSAEFAALIDDRCCRIALVHARALYELTVAALGGPSADLDDVVGKLQRAARLAGRAAGDPALQEPSKRLSVAIDEVAAVVAQRHSRTARVDAVRSVVRRFNGLVQHYSGRDQVVSHVQLGNARASLAQIRAEVDRLSRQHPADSPAGRVLADLRRQCGRYREHLERLGRTVRAD